MMGEDKEYKECFETAAAAEGRRNVNMELLKLPVQDEEDVISISCGVNSNGIYRPTAISDEENHTHEDPEVVDPLLQKPGVYSSLGGENVGSQFQQPAKGSLGVSDYSGARAPDKVDRPELPIHSVSYISVMTFHWITGFMWHVFKKKSLSEEDMWRLSREESTDLNGPRMLRLWKEEVRKNGLKSASLNRVILRFSSRLILIAIIVNIINVIFTFAGPAILFRSILTYAKSSDSNIVFGLMLAVCMLLCDLGRTLSLMMQMNLGFVSACRVRAAIMYLVYDKLLKLRSLKNRSVGEFVNYFTNDCQRVHDFLVMLPMIISGPIIAIASTVYCLVYIGRWALLGAAVIGLYYPYQLIITRLTTYFRRRAVLITDNRIRLISEILVCIKLIKLYAWERSFARAVNAVRSNEKTSLQRAAFLQTMSSALTPLVAVYASVSTVIGHVMSGNDLSVEQAFICIAIYNVTRMKLAQMPHLVRNGAEAFVGLRRAKEILMMEEIDNDRFASKPTDPLTAIEFQEARFAWDSIRRSVDGKRSEDAESGDQSRHQQNGNEHKTKSSASNELKLNGTSDANDEKLKTVGAQVEQDHSEDEYTDVLFNINLVVPKGKLYGVCGIVGSGKSSLLSACLGQMILQSGTVAVDGSLCYVPQQAWILNATLKENILFGMPYDEQKYHDIIERCCLKPDIKMLPAADATEIGERGVTLSGGQKQRVSLARAIYGESDVFLLDDPLSAVDAHVGQHLFEHCLLHASRCHHKTVVLVTHQIQYLNQCDAIVVMKDGSIIEKGTHEQLMSVNDGHYAYLVNTFYAEQRKTKVEETDVEDDETNNDIFRNVRSPSFGGNSSHQSLQNVSSLAGKLIENEQSELGSVSWHTYWTYIRAAGGIASASVVIASFAIPVICASFTDWWLSQWLSQDSFIVVSEPLFNATDADVWSNYTMERTIKHRDDVFYASVYGAIAFSIIAAVCLRGFVMMLATLRASSRLHDAFFKRILSCPMSFFDVTPVGRLLNRFSKDMDEIDVRLPFNCEELMQNACLVLAAIVMIVIGFPWFLLAMILPLIAFLLLQLMARFVMRETKRFENVSRSPLLSHIATTVHGLQSIHACNKESEFINKFMGYVDRCSTATLHFCFTARWLSFRLDSLASLITFVIAIIIVVAKSTIAPAYASMALVYSAKLTGLFQYTIRLASDAEARFTSVERIKQHMESIGEEAPSEIISQRPRSTWPEDGAIVYENYSMRYRPTLPLVLRQVTCHIKPRQKVGIVGRTGSGKTSLVSAIFRLVEPASGSIAIDGIDISTIGLHDLRSKLSIIPQDPVLFIGTVRYNLDPFGEHSDSDIWLALDKCRMKERMIKTESGLNLLVVENGENFSVGERQMLCLARALLRRSKILVMDEATAAVDTETDAAIQETVNGAFSDCTTLIIAHRLNTVLHCDQILVLDHGQVAEFDSPENLLQNSSSMFSEMLRRSELRTKKLLDHDVSADR